MMTIVLPSPLCLLSLHPQEVKF